MNKKDVKSCFSVKKLIKLKKIDFDQRTMCGAPVNYSKYTTANVKCALMKVQKCNRSDVEHQLNCLNCLRSEYNKKLVEYAVLKSY